MAYLVRLALEMKSSRPSATAHSARWRAVVYSGICSSRYVLLLWSASAAASVEVAREIQTAVLCSVPLVPLLLDGTPLPGDVGQVQAIDWR